MLEAGKRQHWREKACKKYLRKSFSIIVRRRIFFFFETNKGHKASKITNYFLSIAIAKKNCKSYDFSVLQHKWAERSSLFTAHPNLEYHTLIWSPYLFIIVRLENFRKYFICTASQKIFNGQHRPDYNTRLKIFALKSSEYRSLNFNLIFCYEIVFGFSDNPLPEIFQICPLLIVDVHMSFSSSEIRNLLRADILHTAISSAFRVLSSRFHVQIADAFTS